ncbi:CDP-alcohol phosphatidyltransferase family protein [Kiloniella sp. b19]|uniref:CDP-alcohol phosphatidyltransferase family protein n=1 Tax=Kiloniella sp. GXU_MW_B19 TaxID=3141326 RepID=UPI0031DD30FE
MFDASLRRIIDPPLNRLGSRLARMGVTPNQITWTGFVIGMLSIPLLAYQLQWLAFVCILLNRCFDGLDGAVARAVKPDGGSYQTDLGGYLDITLDFLFYSGAVFGLILYAPEANALAGAFLIYAFIGTGCSFLAFAILAAKRGISTEIRGKKSIYYLGGLTEGAETIAFLLLACALPQYFAVMAWIFGTLCWMTTAFRIHAAFDAFRD